MVERGFVGKDKVVVITGASSGIGKALAEKYKEQGFSVVGISRTQLNGGYSADITNFDEVKKAFDNIKKTYGKIDILINNAGYGVSGATELIDNCEIKREYDVNIIGQINCYKCAMPLMDKGGKIIFISSACALFPLPYRSLYCSSKAGVHMLSLSLSMECKPLGIEVVSICPGDTKTNFTKNRVKNFQTNERYKNRVENATLALDSRENKRMSVEKVCSKIYKISQKKKNKPFIIIGAKYKFLHFMMRFMPTKVLLFFTERVFGGHKKKEIK